MYKRKQIHVKFHKLLIKKNDNFIRRTFNFCPVILQIWPYYVY